MFSKKRSQIRSFVDRLSFLHILLIWITIIVFFGLLYYFLSGSESFLSNQSEGYISDIKDAIYFSFVTATTTGFGDITPFGSFRIISIIEVIMGLLLLALVTSKLVSIKQDIILQEVYEISFNEKLYRIRSSLLLFRQNLDRLILKIEEGTVRKRDMNSIGSYITSLEDTLFEISNLLKDNENPRFIKGLDSLNISLISNSILNSFEKIVEIITVAESHSTEWKTEHAINMIEKCISLNEDLFKSLNKSKELPKDSISELNIRKGNVIKQINEKLGKEGA